MAPLLITLSQLDVEPLEIEEVNSPEEERSLSTLTTTHTERDIAGILIRKEIFINSSSHCTPNDCLGSSCCCCHNGNCSHCN